MKLILLPQYPECRCISDFVVLSSSEVHNRFNFDPATSRLTELAGFRKIMDFTTFRHLFRSHASFITSPFLCVSFCTCFFQVDFGRRLRMRPSNSKCRAFNKTLFSFLKTFSKFTAMHPIVML